MMTINEVRYIQRKRKKTKNAMCEVMSDVIVCSLNGYAFGIFIKQLSLVRQTRFAPTATKAAE